MGGMQLPPSVAEQDQDMSEDDEDLNSGLTIKLKKKPATQTSQSSQTQTETEVQTGVDAELQSTPTRGHGQRTGDTRARGGSSLRNSYTRHMSLDADDRRQAEQARQRFARPLSPLRTEHKVDSDQSLSQSHEPSTSQGHDDHEAQGGGRLRRNFSSSLSMSSKQFRLFARKQSSEDFLSMTETEQFYSVREDELTAADLLGQDDAPPHQLGHVGVNGENERALDTVCVDTGVLTASGDTSLTSVTHNESIV